MCEKVVVTHVGSHKSAGRILAAGGSENMRWNHEQGKHAYGALKLQKEDRFAFDVTSWRDG